MTKWKYANLDAIRGLAAILIVFRHAPLLFHSPSFPQSYLAVDLFFAISGFVVANAYEARLRSGALGFLAFAKLRLIRLYPLFLLGIVLRLSRHLVAMADRHGRPLPS
ncbi:acyltransferase family protein, partial [Paraburkholderia caribensis]|uniref:acyltransferase family protein n=1 Tax=Paraburkholderia caribensis TaxID=75105 RepID=UPI0015922FAE